MFRDLTIRDVRIVRLTKNVGLRPALNAGLEHCTGEWIMRMDSDDECLIDRAQVQIEFVLEHPNADVVGGWSEQFFDDSPITRIKSSPLMHGAIVQALRWKNILVHPSLLIRADILRSAGGYRGNSIMLEDWDLYVRLVIAQARFYAGWKGPVSPTRWLAILDPGNALPDILLDQRLH